MTNDQRTSVNDDREGGRESQATCRIFLLQTLPLHGNSICSDEDILG